MFPWFTGCSDWGRFGFRPAAHLATVQNRYGTPQPDDRDYVHPHKRLSLHRVLTWMKKQRESISSVEVGCRSPQPGTILVGYPPLLLPGSYANASQFPAVVARIDPGHGPLGVTVGPVSEGTSGFGQNEGGRYRPSKTGREFLQKGLLPAIRSCRFCP
jgi:hypothetical protein